MQKRPMFLFAGGLLAGTALLFGACSGGDDEPAATSTVPAASPSTSATQPASGSPTVTTTQPGSTNTPSGGSSTPAPTTGASPTTGSGLAVCATTNLEVTTVAAGAAAGTHFQVINVKNTGSANCVIEGYPGVSLVDAAGTQVGTDAERSPGIPVTAITLAPGESAHTAVGIPSWQNFPDGTCDEESTQMKIYPPGELTPVLVPFADHACPGFSVRAFEPGASTGPI